MSLKIEILNPAFYSVWNNFVDMSPQGDVFCYSWWLDAITKSKFRIYAAFEDDEIVAGMPLACDRYDKFNEPPLTRTLGVLYKPQLNLNDHKKVSDQRRWLTALLEYIPLDDFVQMCTHHNFTDWLPFRWKGLKQTTRYTYLINYNNKSIDDLRKNLNRDRRNIINRAEKNKIKVEESDDFELMYRFAELSYKRQGIKLNAPFADLKFLDEAIKKNGNRLILKAVDSFERVHAVLYFAFNKRSAYYLLSGSDAELREKGGHSLALWEAVKHFSDKVEYLNFGGSDIKPIEEHIRDFGGVLTPYFHIFNDKKLHRTDIRYHMKETAFHLVSLFKAFKIRFLWN